MIKRLFFIPLFAYLLTGCAYDMGGFKIDRSEFDKKAVKSSEVVEVFVMPQENKEMVDKKCREGKHRFINEKSEGVNSSELMAACAIWTADKKRCFLVLPEHVPVTFLGHEIRHCFEGAFH